MAIYTPTTLSSQIINNKVLVGFVSESEVEAVMNLTNRPLPVMFWTFIVYDYVNFIIEKTRNSNKFYLYAYNAADSKRTEEVATIEWNKLLKISGFVPPDTHLELI